MSTKVQLQARVYWKLIFEYNNLHNAGATSDSSALCLLTRFQERSLRAMIWRRPPRLRAAHSERPCLEQRLTPSRRPLSLPKRVSHTDLYRLACRVRTNGRRKSTICWRRPPGRPVKTVWKPSRFSNANVSYLFVVRQRHRE
jgi:hypothetical protein